LFIALSPINLKKFINVL